MQSRFFSCALGALLLASFGFGASRVSGATAYLNSFGWDKVYRYDTVTGAVTQLPATDILKSTFISSADAGPDGEMYGVASNFLYRITFPGLASNWTKGVQIVDGASEISFSPSGQLYVLNGSNMRQVNTAGLTIAGTTVPLTYNSSAFSPTGFDIAADGSIYAVDSTNIYRINATSGVATLLIQNPTLSPGLVFTEVDAGADGKVRALGSASYLWTYDPSNNSTTGWSASQIMYGGSSISASSLVTGVVPEPGSAGVVVMATAIALSRRRGRTYSDGDKILASTGFAGKVGDV